MFLALFSHLSLTIYQGYEVDWKLNQHLVSIERLNKETWSGHSCMGTIIEKDIILTAAHCLLDKNTGQEYHLKVLVYSERRSRLRSGWNKQFEKGKGMVYNIVKVKIHECYTGTFYDVHNIGLAKINGILPENYIYRNLSKILNTSHYENNLISINGWGSTDKNELTYSNKLMMGIFKISNPKECYIWPTNLIKSICFNSPLNMEMCYGDSGNPIIIDGNMIGMVLMPLIYSESRFIALRFDGFLNWIHSAIRLLDGNA